MSPNTHPMLNIAVKAARAAGHLLNRAALDIESMRVPEKEVQEFVIQVQKACEASLAEAISEAYPQHALWSEQNGPDSDKSKKTKKTDYVWLVDPMGDPTNFMHGYPVYAVSVALSFRGRIEQAVIYDPSRNDLFTASKGRGAYRNDRRIRVAKRSQLDACLLATGLQLRAPEDLQPTFKVLGDMTNHCITVRRSGSAALDMAYVAAGCVDGFFHIGLMPWNVAAGSLLITEAGGLVGNYSGEADSLQAQEIVCANPKIYGQMVAVLKKHSRY